MYFYGSLLGTRQSAIGQSFPLSLETVSEVFAEVTSVLDNMRPPLIKTFFFFLWRQSNRYCGRIHCVCQINVAITSRSCKLKLMLEGTYRFVFTLPYLCFFCIWKLHRNDLFLPCFSEKKIKKNSTKANLTLLFKKTRPNSEVMKSNELRNTQNRSKSTNHKSPNTTFLFSLRRPVRCEGEIRIWLTSQKNPKANDVFDIAGQVLSETAVVTRAQFSSRLTF